MKERKSAADAFPKRPWPGFIQPRTLGQKGLLTGAILSGGLASWWAMMAVRADGLSLVGNAAMAVIGTAMGIYYVREWRKARNTVDVEW